MKNIILMLLVILISACISNPDGPNVQKDIQLSNTKWEGEKSPLRSKYVELKDGSSVLSFVWAGVPGNSISLKSKTLQADIFRKLKEKCGYKPENLIETRIVKHKHPIYYEVWVFKDKKSTRHDKTSGITVFMEALPNGGGVDINYYGNCKNTYKK